MRIEVIAVGRRPPAWAAEAWHSYARRIPAEYRLGLTELAVAGAAERERRLGDEARRIERALPGAAERVVLEERGQPWTTRQLAEALARWRSEAAVPGFVIGGPDGLAEELKGRATRLWSLSRLTLPHALVRVILIEQLYRAMSLLAGHPYHRD